MLQKVINNKKKLYFEEKIAENRNNPKELWRTLTSLDIPSIGGMQSKISLKENGVVSFNSKCNANSFCKFFSNLADSLLQKLPRPKNKFEIKTTESYYKHIRIECEDFVLRNVDVTTIDKILKNRSIQISAKFLKDGAPITAIHLANIINVSIKLSKCKIAKIKPLLKKGIKTEAKNYRPISLLPLISKLIERSIHDQTQSYLQRN